MKNETQQRVLVVLLTGFACVVVFWAILQMRGPSWPPDEATQKRISDEIITRKITAARTESENLARTHHYLKAASILADVAATENVLRATANPTRPQQPTATEMRALKYFASAVHAEPYLSLLKAKYRQWEP